jgi:DNA-directed RNA polymerase subunit RPC12/RpoP
MREHPLKKLSDFDVIYPNSDTCVDSLSSVVRLVEAIGKLKGIDRSWYKELGKFANEDLYLACIQNLSVKQGKSLMDKFPDIAKMWHPIKNGILTPRRISYGSKFNAWWKCECGHEWQRKINDCSSRKRNRCPYCSGKRKSKETMEFNARRPHYNIPGKGN